MADVEPAFTNPGIHILQCIRMKLPARWWSYPNLSAPHWRFYWNPLPGAAVRLQGQETWLGPETAAVIPPHTPFSSSNDEASEQFYIHFVADPPFDRVPPAIFSFPVTRELRKVLDEASLLLSDQDTQNGTRLSLLLHWLAYLALMQVPETQLQPVCVDNRVRKIIQGMVRNLAKSHPNQHLAAEAHMNTNAFIRLFKHHTGHTPQSYLLRRRLDQACQLLCFTNLTIKVIAERTGFCDRYHFSRVFRRHQGMGPATFRNMRSSSFMK